MSITAWYDVWCDDEECLLFADGGGSTRRDAAKAARAVGWKHVKGRWLCPEHQPVAPSSEPAVETAARDE